MIIKTVIIQVLACNGNQLPCIRFFMTNNDMLDKFKVALKKCYTFNCYENMEVFFVNFKYNKCIFSEPWFGMKRIS